MRVIDVRMALVEALVLKSVDGITKREIAEQLGITLDQANDALTALKKAKRVDSTPRSRSVRWVKPGMVEEVVPLCVKGTGGGWSDRPPVHRLSKKWPKPRISGPVSVFDLGKQ
jgi:transposase